MLCPEEQPWGEGAHHQAAEGGAASPGGQAGPAEEAATEPDPEGEHRTEGTRTHARTQFKCIQLQIKTATLSYVYNSISAVIVGK